MPVLTLAATAVTLAAPIPPDTVRAGQLAPEISAKSLSGKPITLSSLRGKVVLLDFWTTT